MRVGLRTCCLMGVAVTGSHCLMAQHVGLTYTAEMQTDFRENGYNWVNLLRAEGAWNLGKGVGFHVASISIAKTREERLANDLQTFSNIEEDNLPLSLAVLGVEWKMGRSVFFGGIRNVNEDYFTSPVTSLFTNSSCGIFPTLSVNFPLANYPVSSVCVDYKLELDKWMWEASVYNGVGYKAWSGRENMFRFCPGGDGIMGVTSVNYQSNSGNGYYMGAALRYGLPVVDEMGNPELEGKTVEKEVKAVVWGYTEQKLGNRVSLLCQGSVAPSRDWGCRSYAGGGLVFHGNNDRWTGGVFVDYADFTDAYEWAGELTCRIPCLKKGYVQPTLHVIVNSRERNLIGLLRLGYEI